MSCPWLVGVHAQVAPLHLHGRFTHHRSAVRTRTGLSGPRISEHLFLCKPRAALRCTLLILDRANPMRSLEISAELQPDDGYAFADKLGRKYGGVDLRMMDRPGESRVVVTLHPLKVNAMDLSR
jgi:hypothetical protein